MVTAIGMAVTGESSWSETLPEIITIALVIVTGFLGMSSSQPVALGNKVLGAKK